MRNVLRRLLAAAVLGLGLAVGTLVVSALVNGRFDLAGCTAAGPFGWTIPLISLLIIGAAAWLLLGGGSTDRVERPETRYVACPSCDRSVLADWRLCPYCGVALEPEDAVAGSVAE